MYDQMSISATANSGACMRLSFRAAAFAARSSDYPSRMRDVTQQPFITRHFWGGSTVASTAGIGSSYRVVRDDTHWRSWEKIWCPRDVVAWMWCRLNTRRPHVQADSIALIVCNCVWIDHLLCWIPCQKKTLHYITNIALNISDVCYIIISQHLINN